MGSLVGKSTNGASGGSNQTPGGSSSGGIFSRAKKIDYSATDTTSSKMSKQEWREYIELGDKEEARGKRSYDVESQDQILRPDGTWR